MSIKARVRAKRSHGSKYHYPLYAPSHGPDKAVAQKAQIELWSATKTRDLLEKDSGRELNVVCGEMAKHEVRRPEQSTKRESCGNYGNYGKLSIPLRSIPSFPQFPQFPQLRLLAISSGTKTKKPVRSAAIPLWLQDDLGNVLEEPEELAIKKVKTAGAGRTIPLTAPFIEHAPAVGRSRSSLPCWGH